MLIRRSGNSVLREFRRNQGTGGQREAALIKFKRVRKHRQLNSAELLGESDEETFRPADVAEPIRSFILHNVAHELGAALAEPLERVVDVVNREHDA